MKRIITSGKGAFDIDAYSCVIALQELKALEGIATDIFIPSGFNLSTPSSLMRSFPYSTECPQQPSEIYIVDVSDPEGIAPCIDLDCVFAIYDHHPGYEQFWRERIGERAIIEPIGAAATLLYEAWVQAGKTDEVTSETARLLAFAIASNTGNFGILLTTERDHEAFNELSKRAGEREGWTTPFFQEVDAQIHADLYRAIIDDTKVKTFPAFGTMAVGQLELSDGFVFFAQHLNTVKTVMQELEADCWYMSVPSLLDRKNYFYAEDREVERMLSSVLGIEFQDGYAVADRLWFRKEILRACIDAGYL